MLGARMMQGRGFYQDRFDSNSLGNYTETHNSGSAATWSISGSALTGNGGAQSIVCVNGFSAGDAYIEADVSQSGLGGLILRNINNSNYYILNISDDSGYLATNYSPSCNLVFTIFGGSGSSGVYRGTWPRGTTVRIGAKILGSTLTAYWNGVPVITWSDSSITGAGKVGMRNHNLGGGVTTYQNFRWGLPV